MFVGCSKIKSKGSSVSIAIQSVDCIDNAMKKKKIHEEKIDVKSNHIILEIVIM